MMEPLLSAQGLTKSYAAARGRNVHALEDVSLKVDAGEFFGCAGESGSGKSTLARLLLRLEEPDAGQMRFAGYNWRALEGKDLRRARRGMQMVFQDSGASLDPRWTAGESVAEPLRIHEGLRGPALAGRVALLLEEVHLPGALAGRYPHELSGGERQRVAIARAIAGLPRLIICDEPLSALDVSVGAQIANLFLELQETRGVSYFFISHDLPAVARAAQRIVILHAGRVVEEGPLPETALRPLHPYTAALLSGRAAGRVQDTDSAVSVFSGCAFEARCPISRPRCRREIPPLAQAAPGQKVACFFPGEMSYPSKL